MKWLTLDTQLLGKSVLKSVKSRAVAESVCKQKKLSVSFWDCRESPSVLSPIFLPKDFYFSTFSGQVLYWTGQLSKLLKWCRCPILLCANITYGEVFNFMDLVWQTHSSGEIVYSSLWIITWRLFWGANNCLWRKRKKSELAAKNSICLEVQEVIPSLAKLKVSNWCKKVISTRAKTLNVKVWLNGDISIKMRLTLCLLILCSSSLAFLWVNQGIFAIYTLHICAVHIFHICCIPHICTDLQLLSSYTLKFNTLHTGIIMKVYCAGTPCVYTRTRVAGNPMSLEKLL